VEETQKTPISIVLFWTGVFIVLLMGGVMAIFWNRLPPQLPWLYSFPVGDKQLINKMWFALIFAGMEVVLILSRIVANWAGKNDETVRNAVIIGVFVAVVLMAASFSRVMMIFLNT
jgi:hypothetical protein